MGDEEGGVQGRRPGSPLISNPLVPGTTIDAPTSRRGFLATLGGVLVLDVVTKVLVVETMAVGDSWFLFGEVGLRHHRNPGVSFSLFESGGAFFGILAILVSIALFVVARRVPSSMALLLGAVAGGALGNVVDRLFRGDGFLDGTVVDFIDLDVWPIFNVADTAIVLGGIALVWVASRLERAEVETPPEAGLE